MQSTTTDMSAVTQKNQTYWQMQSLATKTVHMGKPVSK